MSVGQQRNESQVAVGRKQHKQRKTLDKLLISKKSIIDFAAAPLHKILS